MLITKNCENMSIVFALHVFPCFCLSAYDDYTTASQSLTLKDQN